MTEFKHTIKIEKKTKLYISLKVRTWRGKCCCQRRMKWSLDWSGESESRVTLRAQLWHYLTEKLLTLTLFLQTWLVKLNIYKSQSYLRLTRVSFKRLELSSCLGKVVDIVFCVQTRSQEEHNFGSGCCQALSCCSGNMTVLIMINDCTNVIVALFATNATFQ